MQTKNILLTLFVIIIIILAVWAYNWTILTMEQSLGKVLTYLIISLLIFFVGWLCGRRSYKKKMAKKAAAAQKEA